MEIFSSTKVQPIGQIHSLHQESTFSFSGCGMFERHVQQGRFGEITVDTQKPTALVAKTAKCLATNEGLKQMMRVLLLIL